MTKITTQELEAATQTTRKIYEIVQRIIKARRAMPKGEDAEKVRSWIMQGLGKTIERRFLKSATLVILDRDGSAIEQYIFRLEYPNSETIKIQLPEQGLSSSNRSPSFADFLDQLDFFTTHQAELGPEACSLTMQLMLTRLAPANYAPPEFISCDTSDLSVFKSDNEVHALKIGEANMTSFHNLKLMYKGTFVLIEPTLGESEATSLMNNSSRIESTQLEDDDATDVSSKRKRPSPPAKASSPVNAVSTQDSDYQTHFASRRYAKARRIAGFA